MRIAVLSDIHGNLPALEAVLDAVAPYDALWQLGDVVGYGPQPDEVVERLAKEGALGVRGNHDSAAVGELDTDAFNDDARAAVEWTAERLAPDTRRWLEALPRLREELGFTLTHGSPRDPTWEYIFTADVAAANFPAFSTDHCIVGHTHVPLTFREDAGQVEEIEQFAGSTLDLDSRRTILNPGSVGQPRDGDPRAGAMVLDTESRTIEWHRVEYPIERVQELMTKLRLPPRLVARLRYGL
jgi:predicted phosphodiesterase